MTAIDPPSSMGAGVAAPAPSTPSVPAAPTGRFLGSEGKFFGLLVRGNIFMLLTLGIYRFWLTTDIRRFLWGNTEIAGDTLEYTGTAKELLFGFLLAIVLLLPINAALYVGTLLDSSLFATVTVIGFLALTLLGQFAYFRARRYRLTRTIFRGVRFYQTGSAVKYAIYASLWAIPVLLTLGLIYPWAEASLQRYKMRHTHFGNLQGSFAGSGTSLFFRGILIWLVAILPLALSVAAMFAAIDWATVAELANADDFEKAIEEFGTKNPQVMAPLGFAFGGMVWAFFIGMILYPIYKAITMRWWASGVRLGPIAAVSRLRNGQVYWVYVRFILLSMALASAFSAFFGLFAGLVISFVGTPEEFGVKIMDSLPLQVVVGALAILAYAVFLLASSALYQATVMLRFWRLSFETTELSNLEALDHVTAAGAKSGVFGEGLADALDVGGF